jgi:hypothetical protein
MTPAVPPARKLQNHVYCAGRGGGLWRYNNGGGSLGTPATPRNGNGPPCHSGRERNEESSRLDLMHSGWRKCQAQIQQASHIYSNAELAIYAQRPMASQPATHPPSAHCTYVTTVVQRHIQSLDAVVRAQADPVHHRYMAS